MANGISKSGLQPYYEQPPQVSDTETYSRNILGPVVFELCNLRVEGQASGTQPPYPEQSQYIIASDETFKASVDIKFNNSPLTKLLMCLETELHVDFAFEGIGTAPELELKATETTTKGKFEYTLTFQGTPSSEGLKPGFYAIAAVVSVGPATKSPCDPYVYGFGYIAKALLQVYESFS